MAASVEATQAAFRVLRDAGYRSQGDLYRVVADALFYFDADKVGFEAVESFARILERRAYEPPKRDRQRWIRNLAWGALRAAQQAERDGEVAVP